MIKTITIVIKVKIIVTIVIKVKVMVAPIYYY